MRWAVVNIQSNRVQNIIMLDDPDHWSTPAGFYITQSDTLEIGDIYEGEEE